jgi:hypothetical protein
LRLVHADRERVNMQDELDREAFGAGESGDL